MFFQTVSNIEALRELEGTAESSVEVLGYYEIGDGGGGPFYWDDGSTETDNGSTVIQAVGIVTGRWIRLASDKINAKWFGAKGDGTTDDSASVNKVLSMIDDALTHHVYFPAGIYRVESAAQTTITGKSDFVIEMDDDAKFINDDFASDFIEATATYSGNTATITTSVPHTYITGIQVIMKDFDYPFNGVYTIVVTGTHTFTYTFFGVPTLPSSNGKTRRPDISQTLVTLNSCNNAQITLNFEGTIQPISSQYRLGWVGLKLQNNCREIRTSMKISGLSYGVWSGDFEQDNGNLKDSNFNIYAKNVGYPLALWKSGDNSAYKIFAEDVHRAVYAAAVNNSSFNILTKNYDISGILLSIHKVNATGNLYGCDNLTIDIKDFGSEKKVDLPASNAPRSTVLFFGYDVAGNVEIKNIDLNIHVSNAKYTTPLFIRTANADHKVSNINIRGLIDRRNLIESEIATECTIGDDASGKSGTYSGINFLSWRVYNPSGGTLKPLILKAVNLLDNITFLDFVSTSPKVITMPSGRSVVFPKQGIYTSNTTDTVTKAFLNTNFPFSYHPIGTTVYYYAQNKKFERITATDWISITTASVS